MTLELLSQAQTRLAAAGFGDDLVVSGSRLRSVASGIEYTPATLRVAEIVRFEGESDPDDEAILLAISTPSGDPLGTLTTPYGPAASSEQAEVLRHLHRLVVTSDETGNHDTHDHVTAVFADRSSAEAAIADLREVGLGSEHLGIAIHGVDTTVFEHDEEHDMATEVEAGAGAGAALGLVGGLLLFAVPGLGALGVGGILAIGAASSIGGAMIGGFAGVAAASSEFDEHQALRETHLKPGEVLVVVCGHGHRDVAELAMQRHAGRLFDAGE